MLTIPIFCILGGLVGIYLLGGFGNREYFDGDRWASIFFGSVMGGTVGAFLGLLVAVGLGSTAGHTWVEESSLQLASLRSNDGVSGNFTLGSGYVGSDIYYKANLDYGTFTKPFRVNATSNYSDVRVYQSEGRTTGLLKIYKDSCLRVWYEQFIFCQISPVMVYEFYIPAGSLKQEYRLD